MNNDTQNQDPDLLMIDRRRRNMLLGLGALIGTSAAEGLLSDSGFSVAIAYADSDEGKAAKLFNVAQMNTLKHICQTVIPRTDTAGAGDVNTHGFIDNQLYHCFEQGQQASISKTISLIEKRSTAKHSRSFFELTLSQATQLLNDIDTCKNGFKKKDTEAFKFLKSLIVFGYYTSEIGASEELKYDAVPGGFESEVPLKDIGSAWGSRAFF